MQQKILNINYILIKIIGFLVLISTFLEIDHLHNWQNLLPGLPPQLIQTIPFLLRDSTGFSIVIFGIPIFLLLDFIIFWNFNKGKNWTRIAVIIFTFLNILSMYGFYLLSIDMILVCLIYLSFFIFIFSDIKIIKNILFILLGLFIVLIIKNNFIMFITPGYMITINAFSSTIVVLVNLLIALFLTLNKYVIEFFRNKNYEKI